MSVQQAYINGFVKRAAEYGYSKNEALDFLKEAAEVQEMAPVTAGQGGFMSNINPEAWRDTNNLNNYHKQRQLEMAKPNPEKTRYYQAQDAYEKQNRSYQDQIYNRNKNNNTLIGKLKNTFSSPPVAPKTPAQQGIKYDPNTPFPAYDPKQVYPEVHFRTPQEYWQNQSNK